jgi:uncharacterized protein (DUF1330 family)
MTAYFIVDIKIDDPETYAEYRKLVQPTLDLYGGKFLIRGGATESIEGGWESQRIVILEFEDSAQFRSWYDSPEYSAAKKIRWSASTARAILVQGV